MRTSKQGDIGVAAAILYFTKLGYPVSKPLADSQRYDLVVDSGELLRVECKTASTSRVEMRTKNVLSKRQTLLSAEEIDLLFVYHLDGRQYLIPSRLVDGVQSISLGPKWDKYKV